MKSKTETLREYGIEVMELDDNFNSQLLAAMEAYHEQFNQDIDNSRNWEDDFKFENGNYQCKCGNCGKMFLGYKRRVTCKVCANLNPSQPC